jgi:hypothetical protein
MPARAEIGITFPKPTCVAYAERVPNVRLRYFACRGRAEPIRHFLRDRAVVFEDAREPIADLRETLARLRDDPSRAAPFGLLPVLDWDDLRVTQTLPIASFVGRELGLHARLDSPALARLDAVASAAYSELTSVLPELTWAPLWYPEVPLERLVKRASRTPCGYPARFEQVLGDEHAWFGGAEPHVADFFVFEGLAAWCDVLGPPYAEAIARLPKLSAWWDRACARVVGDATRAVPFTASPHEADVFGRAREFVQAQGLTWLP